MVVTERADSKALRLRYVLTGPCVVVLSTVLFLTMPMCLVYVNCLSTILAVGILVRFLALSFVLRFIQNAPTMRDLRECPSITFVIPCLNELGVLKHTVPFLGSLRYHGKLFFCYIVEAASTDDSMSYLNRFSGTDERFIVIAKRSPPSGRGCAVKYGLSRIPKTEIVAFLDADHTIDQCSLNKVASVFSNISRPIALQGRCLSRNRRSTLLANALVVERQWLEPIELVANPAIGGICYYGSGQGFLSRVIFDDLGYAIDENMILDDIDLSCRLMLDGISVRCSLDVSTLSLQPEYLDDFLDQRIRWIRGWLDVSQKYLPEIFRSGDISSVLRFDIGRFLLYPFAGALFCILWGAAFAGLVLSSDTSIYTRDLAYASLMWPFVTGILPLTVRTAEKRSPTDYVLTLVGMPILFTLNCLLFGSAVVDKYVFQRAACYCKASKDDGVSDYS
jgi:cellulose synthase/poly-beta-1,6-N-acetylglucosamine synthase-like glycosyltransferase